MSVLMPYFWPCFSIGLVVGVIIGVFAFHKWPSRKRNIALGIGAVVAVCLAFVWHGPLGAADRFLCVDAGKGDGGGDDGRCDEQCFFHGSRPAGKRHEGPVRYGKSPSSSE